mgnify:FL=1
MLMLRETIGETRWFIFVSGVVCAIYKGEQLLAADKFSEVQSVLLTSLPIFNAHTTHYALSYYCQ